MEMRKSEARRQPSEVINPLEKSKGADNDSGNPVREADPEAASRGPGPAPASGGTRLSTWVLVGLVVCSLCLSSAALVYSVRAWKAANGEGDDDDATPGPSAEAKTVSVKSVNGDASRTSPEPYVTTVLAVVLDGGRFDGTLCWLFELRSNEDLHEKSARHYTNTTCVEGGSVAVSHVFTYPGTYDVTVTALDNFDVQHIGSTTLRNAYARRDPRDMSDAEVDLWVDALWTVQRTSASPAWGSS